MVSKTVDDDLFQQKKGPWKKPAMGLSTASLKTVCVVCDEENILPPWCVSLGRGAHLGERQRPRTAWNGQWRQSSSWMVLILAEEMLQRRLFHHLIAMDPTEGLPLKRGKLIQPAATEGRTFVLKLKCETNVHSFLWDTIEKMLRSPFPCMWRRREAKGWMFLPRPT